MGVGLFRVVPDPAILVLQFLLRLRDVLTGLLVLPAGGGVFIELLADRQKSVQRRFLQHGDGLQAFFDLKGGSAALQRFAGLHEQSEEVSHVLRLGGVGIPLQHFRQCPDKLPGLGDASGHPHGCAGRGDGLECLFCFLILCGYEQSHSVNLKFLYYVKQQRYCTASGVENQ